MKEDFKYRLKGLLMDFVVIIVSIGYVFYQVVVLKPTNENPLTLIAKGFVGVVVGLVIKQALGENGYIKGYKSDEWVSQNELYKKSCNDTLKYSDKYGAYSDDLYAEKRKKYRIAHLQSVFLHYDKFFDENGDYIERKIIKASVYKWRNRTTLFTRKKLNYYLLENEVALTFRQRITLRKCARVRIHLLNLYSEYSNDTTQDTKREMTDKRQRSGQFFSNFLGAVAISAIGVYFLPEIVNWNWGAIIGSLIQVSIWVGFGVLQLYKNYNYIVKDKVNLINQKKLLLEQFLLRCEKGQYDEKQN